MSRTCCRAKAKTRNKNQTTRVRLRISAKTKQNKTKQESPIQNNSHCRTQNTVHSTVRYAPRLTVSERYKLFLRGRDNIRFWPETPSFSVSVLVQGHANRGWLRSNGSMRLQVACPAWRTRALSKRFHLCFALPCPCPARRTLTPSCDQVMERLDASVFAHNTVVSIWGHATPRAISAPPCPTAPRPLQPLV